MQSSWAEQYETNKNKKQQRQKKEKEQTEQKQKKINERRRTHTKRARIFLFSAVFFSFHFIFSSLLLLCIYYKNCAVGGSKGQILIQEQSKWLSLLMRTEGRRDDCERTLSSDSGNATDKMQKYAEKCIYIFSFFPLSLSLSKIEAEQICMHWCVCVCGQSIYLDSLLLFQFEQSGLPGWAGCLLSIGWLTQLAHIQVRARHDARRELQQQQQQQQR